LSQHFSYSVSTVLSRDRVWAIFSDIENWPKFSDVYSNLRWSGVPWKSGSSLLGTLRFTRAMPVNYLLETCRSGSFLRYVGYSKEAGFASHRTVRFEQQQGRTMIVVDCYIVGTPTFAVAGGAYGFLRTLTETWFRDFAALCDTQAESNVELEHRDTKSLAIRAL